jgi:hypothetical protein
MFFRDNENSKDEENKENLLVVRANVHEDIASIFPANNALNVSLNTEIKFNFQTF